MDNFQKIMQAFEALNGKELDMKEYENRLRLQKIVYLLQTAGLKLGDYQFYWYIRGPYSPALTKYIFESLERPAETHKNAGQGTTEKKVVETLKAALKDELRDVKKLELLGSLVFIRNDENIRDKTELLERMYSRKPWYPKEEIAAQIEKIEACGLFN